jgi:hypothetical protein
MPEEGQGANPCPKASLDKCSEQLERELSERSDGRNINMVSLEEWTDLGQGKGKV